MKSKLFLTLGLWLASLSVAFATPTPVFWTYCTTDVQPEGTYHGQVNNYFSVGNRKKNGRSFPPDIGLRGGVFSWEGLGGEVGIDYLGGASDPVYFHGKVGLIEGRFFERSPSVSIGVFNVGTAHRTSQAVVDLVFGTTLPKEYGRAFAGLYIGKRALGNKSKGWMVAYQRGFYSVKDDNGKEYNKWQFNADFASGKNAIGGGGVGFTYFFTSKIALATGPTWFVDTARNGRWKWAIQLGIDI